MIDDKHKKMVRKLIEIYATYTDSEDLINIGAYAPGSNPNIDRAIDRIDHINAFLRQEINESTPHDEMLKMLEEAIGGVD